MRKLKKRGKPNRVKIKSKNVPTKPKTPQLKLKTKRITKSTHTIHRINISQRDTVQINPSLSVKQQSLNSRFIFYLIFAISVCLGTIYMPQFLVNNLSDDNNFNLITGRAIGGMENYQETELTSIPQSTAMINPKLGNIVVGKEFTVEVIAYPYITGVTTPQYFKTNNFFVKITYDPNELSYKFAQPLINNYILQINDVLGELTIKGIGKSPFDDVYVFEPQKFVEIQFLALKQKDNLNIKLEKFSSMNSFGKGTSAEVITNYPASKLTVLEKGMDNFIPDYVESTPTYSGSQYWSKMLPKEKKEIQDAWNKLAPADKEKYKSCTPNCQGKQCGTDGCGGFCGTLQGKCGGDKVCINNKCSCQPNCAGKSCGDDGCGGLCYAKICIKEEVPGLGKLWKDWKDWYIYAVALILLAILISLGVVFRKRIKQNLFGAGQATQQFTKQVAQDIRTPPTKETKPEPQIRQQAIKQQSISQQSPAPIPHAPPQLVNYINQQIAKGVPKDKIKESLGRVGWKEEIVEAGFKEIGNR